MTLPAEDPKIMPSVPPPPDAQDWLLEEAVELANKIEGFSLAITLAVPGGVVTGTLIGAKEYYTRYGALWGEGLGGEAGRTVEEHWVQFGKDTHELFASEHPETSPLPPPQYIHLRDARYVIGTSIVPDTAGLLWRGRLSEVVGFSLGTLGRAG